MGASAPGLASIRGVEGGAGWGWAGGGGGGRASRALQGKGPLVLMSCQGSTDWGPLCGGGEVRGSLSNLMLLLTCHVLSQPPCTLADVLRQLLDPPPQPARPSPWRRFFEDYKKNEHKEVIVDDFLGAKEAIKVVKECLVSSRTRGRGRGGGTAHRDGRGGAVAGGAPGALSALGWMAGGQQVLLLDTHKILLGWGEGWGAAPPTNPTTHVMKLPPGSHHAAAGS